MQLVTRYRELIGMLRLLLRATRRRDVRRTIEATIADCEAFLAAGADPSRWRPADAGRRRSARQDGP